jgi:hypothetical protein
MGGAFWEFGAPDWDRTKLFVMFGVAEDHDSNPIKMGIGKLKARGARVIAVNPIRTGYNALPMTGWHHAGHGRAADPVAGALPAAGGQGGSGLSGALYQRAPIW